MDLMTIILGCILFCLIWLYRRRKSQQSLFICLDVPGPKPHWFWGNVLLPKDRYLLYHNWTKKYGQIYGFYEGPTPWLVVSDLDFLHHVMIKKFSHFSSRRQYPIEPHPDSDNPFMYLFSIRGARWKNRRMIINPTFSSAKLKQIAVLVNNRVKIMLTKIQDIADGKSESLQNVYKRLTLDVIADAAFGLDIDTQNNSKEPFLQKAEEVVEQEEEQPFFIKLAALFPEVRHLAFRFIFQVISKCISMPEVWIRDKFGQVLKSRRKQKVYRVDLMQLLMDAVATTNDGEPQLQMTHFEYQKTFRTTLTDEEIQDECFLFLMAGYETTSSLLTYLTYLLAINPDKQTKLQEEIDEHFTNEDEVTYDSVMKLPYLDMCINESLRLYPVGTNLVSRQCTEPCVINGMNIPAGLNIQADVWTIHHNPKLWGDDPWSFIPERFSPENKAKMHPIQLLSFGVGPRNCIGMRFGMMEAKIAMVQIMNRFTFKKNDQTEIPLILKESVVVIPKNDNIKITIVCRNEKP